MRRLHARHASFGQKRVVLHMGIAILQTRRLDPNSHEQLYYQLYDILFQEITGGSFSVGDLVPSETRLVEEFGISRETARKAMGMLVDDGLVERRRGVGSVVVATRPKTALNWTNSSLRLSDDPSIGVGKVEKRVLDAGVVLADPKASGALNLPLDTPLFRLDRVRCKGETPYYRETILLEANYVPGATERDFSNESLRAYYKNVLHVTWPRATQVMKSVGADEETARVLHVEKGFPLLEITRVSFDERGIPREFGVWRYRSILYYLEMSLVK